jgi:hypothetical protein
VPPSAVPCIPKSFVDGIRPKPTLATSPRARSLQNI